MRFTTFSLVAFAAIAPSLIAQPNAVKGKDASLYVTEQLNQAGRMGTYPNGRNGLSIGVRICNVGTVNIDWRAPMNPLHPFYSFIVCRESAGRFAQVSNRSWLKHGFLSTNSNGCGICRTTPSTILGPNCSDTYSSGLNADRFYLGPPQEIDPWLGTWDPNCSHFDRGEPAVSAPFNCDGIRSLTQQQAAQMNPVTHRVEVDDQDLDVKGASFFYGSYPVIVGEPEENRENNAITRSVDVSWNGSRWQFRNHGTMVNGSILQHWSGSLLSSNSNANDDGRFYVAVKVTGPDSSGLWHYEYAVHNRDNSRAAATFRVPLCANARVLNAGVRDIDKLPANDWTVSVSSNEVAFLAGAENALEWNTIYNFWFDSDAAPLAGQITIDQARPGPGAADLTVDTEVPSQVYNQYLGAGCGTPAPSIAPAGNPPIAQIPNPTFGLQLALSPSSAAAVFVSGSGGSIALGSGCFLFVGLPPALTIPVSADPQGAAALPVPIPNMPAFEGAELFVQGAELASGGPVFGALNLTNGLKIRIGNSLAVCP